MGNDDAEPSERLRAMTSHEKYFRLFDGRRSTLFYTNEVKAKRNSTTRIRARIYAERLKKTSEREPRCYWIRCNFILFPAEGRISLDIGDVIIIVSHYPIPISLRRIGIESFFLLDDRLRMKNLKRLASRRLSNGAQDESRNINEFHTRFRVFLAID